MHPLLYLWEELVISAKIAGDHKLKSGHISMETDWGCSHRLGSNPEYAETVPNMCKKWENMCYRSTPSLFTMPCQMVLFKIVPTRALGGA